MIRGTRYVCMECHEHWDREELTELREPHGEVTLHCPNGCTQGLEDEDDWDPTPYIAEVK